MLCNIYVSCKIHGLICAALRAVVFSAGAEGPPPPPTSLASSPIPQAQAHPWSGVVGLAALAPGLGIWVSGGIKAPFKDAQKHIPLHVFTRNPHRCPGRTRVMCLAGSRKK